jgi:arylsulfatase
VIFTDDQGYGDLGCFGSKTIRTPRIDALAKEGLKLTSFYAQPVCGPSRTALLTGCYPRRVAADGRGWQLKGKAVTVAEVLKEAGYTTCCIGKWDVSGRRNRRGMMPNDQGFDHYFGTWGANDSGRVRLVRNRKLLESTKDMASLTGRYTDEAIEFLRGQKDGPFFLYLAHTMAHVVIDASERFKGTSKGDLYGDVIEEIDWNVGRVIDALKDLGLAENTIVVFTSDNGPWCQREAHYRKTHGGHLATGSPGPLRGHKASNWEGGVRVPCVVWGPGHVPGGRESAGIAGTIDFLPTFATLAGGQLPPYEIDGVDQSALFTTPTTESARDRHFYYRSGKLQAVRQGRWKLFLGRNRKKGKAFAEMPPDNPQLRLYDLENDIGEKSNVAKERPDTVRELLKLADWAAEHVQPIKELG